MNSLRRGTSALGALAILVGNPVARPAQAQGLTQSFTANGPLRLQVDAPAANATVYSPFLVGGWALDQFASAGSGIDAVHVWAVPVSGPAIFLGAATMD